MAVVKKLTNICLPKQWKTIPMSELSAEGYLCYGANGIIGKYREYNHENETVLITCRGATCGTVTLAQPKSYINGNAMCLDNLDENILTRYLFYFLKNYNFNKAITGSAQPQITRQSLSKIDVLIYDIKTQQEIIHIFDLLEKLLSKVKLCINCYDNFVKSQFIEMFGDINVNDKKWPIVHLPEISIFYNGLTYSPKDINENGTIVLRSSNIQNGLLDFNDIVRVDCNINTKYFVNDNDILMCSRNGSSKLVGKVALINNVEEPMCFGAFMMIIRSKYSTYLKTIFESDYFRGQISSGISTTTINQITNEMLKKVYIPLPNDSLLKSFDHFYHQIDKSKITYMLVIFKNHICDIIQIWQIFHF